jgi:hypothetical protein
LVIISCLVIAWPPLHDWAAKYAKLPFNRKTAGPTSIVNTPSYLWETYINRGVWAMTADNLMFRLIES